MGATRIGAWTREDQPTLRWYAARGFAETFRYLHVYSSVYSGDPADPRFVSTFAHAPIEREAELRAVHHRVYVCRCLELDVPGVGAGCAERPAGLGGWDG